MSTERSETTQSFSHQNPLPDVSQLERARLLGQYYAQVKTAGADLMQTVTNDMALVIKLGLARTSEKAEPSLIYYPTPHGDLIYNLKKKEVTSPLNPNGPVQLSNAEAQILSALIEEPENILPSNSQNKGNIMALRRKLISSSKAYPKDILIKTVNGRGYYIPADPQKYLAPPPGVSEQRPVQFPRLEFSSPAGHSIVLFTSRNIAFSSLVENNKPIRLTKIQTKILEVLIRHPEASFSTHALGDLFDTQDIVAHISHTRSKLGDKTQGGSAKKFRLIHTTPKGYSLTDYYDIKPYEETLAVKKS